MLLWYRANKVIDDSFTIMQDLVKVRNELLLSKLGRKDLGVVLTCQAVNNNYSKPISASVTLDLNREWHSVKKVFCQ